MNDDFWISGIAFDSYPLKENEVVTAFITKSKPMNPTGTRVIDYDAFQFICEQNKELMTSLGIKNLAISDLEANLEQSKIAEANAVDRKYEYAALMHQLEAENIELKKRLMLLIERSIAPINITGVSINRITIGDYEISKINDESIFIKHESGEGGQFPLDSLEALIKQFYEDHF